MEKLNTFDSSTGLAVAASLLTVAVVYYHIKTFSYWSSRGIKGPTPWPIFGTSFYYLFDTKVNVDTRWREKYGDVFGIYEGYKPTLRINDPELVKHVFVKNFNSFTDRNNLLVHGKAQKRWLFWSKGSHWSNQRVLITPMTTSSRMRVMFKKMYFCAQRFLEEINARTRDAIGGKLPEDSIERQKLLAKASESVTYSKDELMAFTLDVIGQSFFSLKLNTYRDKASEFFKRAFAFAQFDFGWFIVWLLIPSRVAAYFELDLVRPNKFDYFEKLSQSCIDERRKNSDKRQNDFVQMLFESKLPDKYENVFNAEDDNEAHYNVAMTHQELDEINRKQAKAATFRHFEDAEIRSQMTFFFLAGFETTSSSISFCLYELAHRPDIQDELYEEVKTLPRASDKLEYSDLLSLKKLDAFVSEALRLYSPLTEHNRLVTEEEGVVLPTEPPVHLPKNTVISVNGFLIQRNEKYWPEPLKFDMSRFYVENRGNINPCSYMPFGAGPRNCLGMRFALLNIKLFLAILIRDHFISPAPATMKYPPDFNRHAFFLQLKHTDFLLSPRGLSQ